MLPRAFKVGEWVVRVDLGRIESDRGALSLEPKAMDLLVALAEARGEVVTQAELRARLWPATFVAEGGVFRLVSELRRHLGDDPRAPRYIETIPKRGYRLVAEVSELPGAPRRHRAAPSALAALAGAGAVAVTVWWQAGTPGARPRRRRR